MLTIPLYPLSSYEMAARSNSKFESCVCVDSWILEPGEACTILLAQPCCLQPGCQVGFANQTPENQEGEHVGPHSSSRWAADELLKVERTHFMAGPGPQLPEFPGWCPHATLSQEERNKALFSFLSSWFTLGPVHWGLPDVSICAEHFSSILSA